MCFGICCCCSIAKSCLTLCDPVDKQHIKLPCPSLSPGACSNSCPLSWWCHPIISSSVVPLSCNQSFPASGSFSKSRLFTSCGQNTGVSASASVLPMSIQGLFPLGLTGLISLLSKSLSKSLLQHHSSKAPQFKSINSSAQALPSSKGGFSCKIYKTQDLCFLIPFKNIWGHLVLRKEKGLESEGGVEPGLSHCHIAGPSFWRWGTVSSDCRTEPGPMSFSAGVNGLTLVKPKKSLSWCFSPGWGWASINSHPLSPFNMLFLPLITVGENRLRGAELV